MGERLKLKCPKCRAMDYALVETFEEHVIYSVRGGVMPGHATDHEPGSILCVTCECDGCGHKWKPRGIAQWHDAVLLEIANAEARPNG